MFRSLGVLRVWLAVSLLAALITLALQLTMLHLEDQNALVDAEWSAFERERSEKPRLGSHLLATLGYGGLIHNFKNFLLRGDDRYHQQTLADISAARTILSQYEALGISGDEAVALEDLRGVLDAHEKALQAARAMHLASAGVGAIAELTAVDAAPALRALDTLRKAWTASGAAPSTGADRSGLRAAIGYGGVIHRFKDYVIYGEDADRAQVVDSLSIARRALADYRRGRLTSIEEMALADIEETLATYEGKLERIAKMVAAGTSPERVDLVVKVDDTKGLRGLEVIERAQARQVEERAQRVYDSFAETGAVWKYILWGLPAAAALFILAFHMILRAAIANPLERVSDATGQAAGGALGIRIPEVDRQDEIGDIARAVDALRGAAREHRQGERDLLHRNDLLTAEVAALQDMRERSEQQAAQAVGLAESLAVARDEAERAIARAEADERRIKAILDTVRDAIITIDGYGTIETFNPSAAHMFGYQPDEIIGYNVSSLMPEPHRSAHDDYITAYLAGSAPKLIGMTREETAIRRDGSTFPIELSVSVMRIGEEIKFTGVIKDITERKAAEEEIRRLAMEDPLTGLANRNQFARALDGALRMARREGWLVALMMLDLDKFKPVNDTYGHPVGDALLQAVASLLTEAARTTDTVARLGGDEFAMILIDPQDRAAIERPAGRVLSSLCTPIQAGGHTLHIGTSIGIAVYPNDADTPDDLVRRADMALYAAKDAGRNCHRFFDPSMEADEERAAE